MPRDFLLKAWVDQWLRQTIERGAFAKIRGKWPN